MSDHGLVGWVLLAVSTANSFTKLVFGESVYTTFLGLGEPEMLLLYTFFFALSLCTIAAALGDDR